MPERDASDNSEEYTFSIIAQVAQIIKKTIVAQVLQTQPTMLRDTQLEIQNLTSTKVNRRSRSLLSQRMLCRKPPHCVSVCNCKGTELSCLPSDLVAAQSSPRCIAIETVALWASERTYNLSCPSLIAWVVPGTNRRHRPWRSLDYSQNQGSSVWFLCKDKIVETKIKACLPCQVVAPIYTGEPLQMSKLPYNPFDEVSIDFAQEDGWLMTIRNSRLSSQCHIHLLVLSYPSSISRSAGLPFDGNEFAKFAWVLGFRYRKVTQLSPRANGEVESFEKTLTKSIKAAKSEGKTFEIPTPVYSIWLNICVTGISVLDFVWITSKGFCVCICPESSIHFSEHGFGDFVLSYWDIEIYNLLNTSSFSLQKKEKGILIHFTAEVTIQISQPFNSNV